MDTVVLTANRRLAGIVRQDYAVQQQIHDRQVWETPTILPLQTWLQNLWRSHPLESDQLLTPLQERQLWSDIIQETCHSTYPLLHVDNTVQLVQQAWELLNHWDVIIRNAEESNHFGRSQSVCALGRTVHGSLPPATLVE